MIEKLDSEDKIIDICTTTFGRLQIEKFRRTCSIASEKRTRNEKQNISKSKHALIKRYKGNRQNKLNEQFSYVNN